MASHQKLTMTSWEPSSKLILLWEVVEELSVDHSTVVWLLKQIGKMKKLNKVGTSWTDWKSKVVSLSSVIFSNCTQQQQTISQSDCDTWQNVDFIRQPATTNSVVGPRRSPKALPKAKLTPKKGSWSLCGGLLLVWFTTAFWIPAKPLHLRGMLSKLITCTKNCNACSWQWSTERAQFFSTTTPDCMSHNQHFKTWMNWATKFCLICQFHLT